MPVPGGGHTVGGGVRSIHDGCITFLLVETACMSTVIGVQGGYGVMVAGSPPTYGAWEVNGWETALGDHGN